MTSPHDAASDPDAAPAPHAEPPEPIEPIEPIEPAEPVEPALPPPPEAAAPSEPSYVEAVRWWLVAAGIMLMLPRQWPSAGIAFLLALVCHAVVRRRRRPSRAQPGAPA